MKPHITTPNAIDRRHILTTILPRISVRNWISIKKGDPTGSSKEGLQIRSEETTSSTTISSKTYNGCWTRNPKGEYSIPMISMLNHKFIIPFLKRGGLTTTLQYKRLIVIMNCDRLKIQWFPKGNNYQRIVISFRQRAEVKGFYCPDNRSSCRIPTKRNTTSKVTKVMYKQIIESK